jgi:hypothetical protein
MCHVVIRPGPQDRDRVAEAINEADNGWRGMQYQETRMTNLHPAGWTQSDPAEGGTRDFSCGQMASMGLNAIKNGTRRLKGSK